jgi:ADP-ribose pyrophosphatase YjhB (NUDIX family)
MTQRISVRGIVLHEGKLLCVRLQKAAIDYWCLPGGGLEAGESLHDGLNREMIEETGIKPVVANLLYIQQFAADDHEYLDFFFHITNSLDYLAIDLSKTTHGEQEIAEIDFVEPTKTYILPEFLSTDNIQQFAESNTSTRIISRL